MIARPSAMFGIGLNEWLLIAVLALTVLGPERLSTLARTAGAAYRHARIVWAMMTSGQAYRPTPNAA